MAKEIEIYLSIGTNIGNRKDNIFHALNLLDDGLGVHYNALSSIIETPAWGFEGADFLNCAVRYVLSGDDITPEELLSLCKEIEKKMGRDENVEFDPSTGKRLYHNRIIDIDILLFGDMVVDTPSLKIPHPLMKEREFVMTPLMEIYHSK